MSYKGMGSEPGKVGKSGQVNHRVRVRSGIIQVKREGACGEVVRIAVQAAYVIKPYSRVSKRWKLRAALIRVCGAAATV